MKVLIAVSLAIAGFVAWYFMTRSTASTAFGGVGAPEETGVLFVIYGYVVTVFGVVLGSCYRALERMKAQGILQINDFKAFFVSAFRSIDFSMALFASPIVYAMIWKTFGGRDIAALTIVGLENGFACLAVISSLLRRKSGGRT